MNETKPKLYWHLGDMWISIGGSLIYGLTRYITASKLKSTMLARFLTQRRLSIIRPHGFIIGRLSWQMAVRMTCCIQTNFLYQILLPPYLVGQRSLHVKLSEADLFLNQHTHTHVCWVKFRDAGVFNTLEPGHDWLRWWLIARGQHHLNHGWRLTWDKFTKDTWLIAH